MGFSLSLSPLCSQCPKAHALLRHRHHHMTPKSHIQYNKVKLETLNVPKTLMKVSYLFNMNFLSFKSGKIKQFNKTSKPKQGVKKKSSLYHYYYSYYLKNIIIIIIFIIIKILYYK
jgi:hypothetical protein